MMSSFWWRQLLGYCDVTVSLRPCSSTGLSLLLMVISTQRVMLSYLLNPFWNHLLSLQSDWLSVVWFIHESHHFLLIYQYRLNIEVWHLNASFAKISRFNCYHSLWIHRPFTGKLSPYVEVLFLSEGKWHKKSYIVWCKKNSECCKSWKVIWWVPKAWHFKYCYFKTSYNYIKWCLKGLVTKCGGGLSHILFHFMHGLGGWVRSKMDW